jgi:predicted enzyme related to lactoylglutathione lyase
MSVSGIDAIVERVVKLGMTVVSPPADRGGGIVRIATIHDTQGAELTVGTDDPSVRVTR